MGLFNLFKKKKKEVVWDKTMEVLFCFKRDTFTIGDILKAFSIEELDNGITCVQLYSNHEDFNKPECRQVQLSFKEWMGYKKLAEASQ